MNRKFSHGSMKEILFHHVKRKIDCDYVINHDSTYLLYIRFLLLQKESYFYFDAFIIKCTAKSGQSTERTGMVIQVFSMVF